jgi:hypothetical protein
MLKKLSKVIVALTIVSIMSVGTANVFAESNEEVLTHHVTFDETIRLLEPYVSADNNQFQIASIPATIKSKLGVDVIESIENGIAYMNHQATGGDLVITNNETVYSNEDNSFVIQGGNVNDVEMHWWGYEIDMSHSSAKKVAYIMNRTGYKFAESGILLGGVGLLCSSGAAVQIASVIGVPTGVVTGAIALSFVAAGTGLGAVSTVCFEIEDDINYHNGSRGVELDINWSGKHKVKSQ